MQVALTTPAKKAIGIELSATRHEQATWVIEQLQQKHGRRLDHVQLLEDDITSCSYQGGTHFLLCSTAFSASGGCSGSRANMGQECKRLPAQYKQITW